MLKIIVTAAATVAGMWFTPVTPANAYPCPENTQACTACLNAAKAANSLTDVQNCSRVTDPNVSHHDACAQAGVC
jgi:hypothetical protein